MKSIVADLISKSNGKSKMLQFSVLYIKGIEEFEFPFNIDTTSEIVDIGQMPTSCSDLQRMGHKLSGFFSVKGSKKMEMVYCDFSPNQNGMTLTDEILILLLFNKHRKMDRIRRRQIGARPFLRPAQF